MKRLKNTILFIVYFYLDYVIVEINMITNIEFSLMITLKFYDVSLENHNLTILISALSYCQ